MSIPINYKNGKWLHKRFEKSFGIGKSRNGFCFRDGAVVLYLLSDKGQKEIQGETLISPCDLDRVLEFGKWHFRRAGIGYPVAFCRKNDLHRFIMDAPEGMVVDHINGNTLDNRRENLRSVTHVENTQNSHVQARSKSGVKNVWPNTKTGKWIVQIRAKGKSFYFGTFEDLDKAAKVAAEARKAIHECSPDNSGYPERADPERKGLVV